MSAVTRFGVVENYCISIDYVPPVVLSEKKRKALFDRWVNPEIERSEKDSRAAVARYFGGWEEGSGLLFDTDVWQRRVHIIKPLWDDDNVPDDLTKCRVIDYAPRAGINVCGWFAVGPRYAVCYRMIYEKGLEIAEFVQKIIEMSHNNRVFLKREENDRTGDILAYYEEQQVREKYWGGTIIDSRSLSQAQKGETLAEVFERYGIQDISPACGQNDDIQIPRLKDWMRIDFDKEHPWNRDENGNKMMGCPKLFFFDDRCDGFVKEIEGLRHAPPGSSSYLHPKDPCHAVDVCKYFVSSGPRYMGDLIGEDEYKEDGYSTGGSKYTGY